MDPTGEESSAGTTERGTDPRPRHIVLGVDAEGRIHHYRTRSESVIIVANGELVHREDIPETPVDEWVAFVDDRVGWTQKDYGEFWGRVAAAFREAC